MTTDDMVFDVSLDWVLTCDVQQRFMQGLGRTSDSVDYSALPPSSSSRRRLL